MTEQAERAGSVVRRRYYRTPGEPVCRVRDGPGLGPASSTLCWFL